MSEKVRKDQVRFTLSIEKGGVTLSIILIQAFAVAFFAIHPP